MKRSTGFPKDVIELVTARSGGNCEIMSSGCSYTGEEYHHRRCRGMGSTRRPDTNLASNCLHVCRRCHLKAHAMPAWARDNGFILRQSDHPAAEPLWWRCNEHGGKDFMLLDDSGDTIPIVRAAQ